MDHFLSPCHEKIDVLGGWKLLKITQNLIRDLVLFVRIKHLLVAYHDKPVN